MVVYKKSLIALFILFFFSNAIAYLPDYGLFPFQPFQSIVFFVLISLPLIGLRFLKSDLKAKINPLAIWVFVYLILSFLFFIFSRATPFNALQQVKYNFLTFCVFLIGLILFDSKEVLYIQKLVFGVLIVSILLNFYDLTHPLVLTENIGRASGMYLNPNVSALAILVALILSLSVIPEKLKTLIVVSSGLAIISTFSRAGLFSYFIFLLICFIYRKINFVSIFSTSFITVILISVTVSIDFTELIGPENAELLFNRINFFGNKDALNYDSSYQRADLLLMGINKYLENPIFGIGVGGGQEVSNTSYSDQSTHNQFIYILIEFGIFGFILLVSLFLIVFRSDYQKVKSFEVLSFMLIYIFNCLFSHNMLDSYFLLMGIVFVTIFDVEHEEV
jgi:O-antigen ligase